MRRLFNFEHLMVNITINNEHSFFPIQNFDHLIVNKKQMFTYRFTKEEITIYKQITKNKYYYEI